jgi:hypothetical protein
MQENIKLKKRKIAIAVIVFVLVFLSVIFFGTTQNIKTSINKTPSVVNNSIVYNPPQLSIFDATVQINTSPDKILFHAPYFIVVVPENYKKITTIYSLLAKKETASYNDTVLDYYNGNFLYNWHGNETYYNKKDLGLRCQSGVIKSATEILCITPKITDSSETKLISINPKTLAQKDIYNSQNVPINVFYVNNTLYIAEINLQKHKTYLIAGNTTIETPYLIDLVYPMDNKLYAASYKTIGINPYYYQIIETKGGVQLTPVGSGRIVFYQ